MPIYGDNQQGNTIYTLPPGVTREQVLLLIIEQLQRPEAQKITEIYCTISLFQAWCRLAAETAESGTGAREVFHNLDRFRRTLFEYRAKLEAEGKRLETGGRAVRVLETEPGAVCAALLAATIDRKVVLLINDDGSCETIKP